MSGPIASIDVNLIVAASNVFGLPALAKFISRGRYWNAAMTSVLIAASTLMHLSERKHRLPGVYPFNRYTQTFLNIDRAMTIVGTAWFGYQFWDQASMGMWVEMFTGMAFLRYSEWLAGPEYAMPHVIWHFAVYDLLLSVAKL